MATFDFTPDSIDQEQLQRKQRLADLLMQNSMQQDQGRMVGNYYVAPSVTQNLNKLAQGLVSRKMEASALESKRALAEQLRQRQADEWAGVTEQISNPAQAYARALQSQDPALRQFGMQGMSQIPQMEAQKQERIDARTFRQQEAEANRAAQAEALQQRLADARISQAERLQAQRELRDMQIQAQRDNIRFAASLRQPPQAQIIQTAEGPAQLVNGRAVPIIGVDGKPVRGNAQAGVTPTARAQDARDALSTIDMAEKLIDKSTGSGIGSALDSAAAFFGTSTRGAQAAAQLKALEGDLVAKMPKMSGPQSDKDVLLYKQMAGQIGDPSIPPATKKAALQSIREMQIRYASGGAQISPPADTGGWGIQQIGQ